MMFGFGSNGETVKQIQRKVNVTVDGIYGPLTTQAVRDYQSKNGLTADGVVGPLTMEKMNLFPTTVIGILKKAGENLYDAVVHSTPSPN